MQKHKPCRGCTKLRLLFVLMIGLLLSAPAHSQIPGSYFGFELPMGTYNIGGPYSFSDTKNTNGYGDMFGTYGEDIFYRFEVTGTADLVLTLQGDVSCAVYLLDNARHLIAYNADNVSGNSNTINTNVVAGSYYVVIEPLGSNDGNLNLDASFTVYNSGGAATEGVNMGNAIVMGAYNGGPVSYSDSRSNAPVNGYGNDFGQFSDDVFYKFTLGGAGTITVSTCGSNFNTYLHLLDANGNVVSSNDDNGPSCSGDRASLQASLQAGTYYVVVEGYFNWSGTYQLNVTGTVSGSGPATEGVNMGNAILIGNYGSGSYSYNDSRNNSSANGYGNEMGQASDDIYYKVTVQHTADLDISLCGSGFDTYLYLLNSSGTVIQSNDDGGPLCAGITSSIRATGLAAGTYYIVTEGSGSSTGALNLSVNTVVQAAPQGGPVTLSQNQNYIYTRTILKDNVKTQGDLDALTAADVRAELQYFDGLGRPVQNISVQAAPDYKDIVTPMAYDAFGRQDKGYLPYAASGTSGSYRSSGLAEQASFYGTAQTSIPAIPNPYSQTVFEASPLNRVLEVAAPGQSWAVGNGHTMESRYEINTVSDQVRLWNIQNNGTVNTGATSSGYYNAGQLYKNITKDEQKNLVIEYKDKEGQVVCKKVQDGGTEQAPSFMVTQYIYDDFNQLVYVLPPALENTTGFTEGDADFLNYIYAYHYDGRRRLIEKKVPGKGWEYTVYNAADRPVYSSDVEQRNRGAWSFVKYDGLGRAIMTGEAFMTLSTTRADLQTAVNNTLKPVGGTELYETYTGAGGSSNMGYSNTSLPNTNFKIFTVNYYDDYNILTVTNPYPAIFVQPSGTQNESQRTKGLPTVTATNILGTSTYLYTAAYYTEDKARVSKVVKQHQLGGADVTTNNYNFVGELTSSMRKHYNNNNTASAALTVTTANQYDQAGRLKQTQETINSQQPVTTNYTYNAVGQLERKSVGGQDIDYKYNARGWMTRQSSALFTQELKYDDASQNPQFNGNIAQQLWTTGGQSHSYNYSYDKANRLLSGISDENYNETLTYDKMGNVLTLNRQGAPTTIGVGNMVYDYGSKGNQLQSVSGGYNYSKSYQYDGNGSMTIDGTVGFQYNELNLPMLVVGTPVGVVAYVYDAAGSKLTKQTVSETRQYVSGIEYNGANIELLHLSGGLARNSGGTYNYEFFLGDHLGNTRVVHNGSGTVYQRTDYMPFGMSIGRVANTPNKYLYNGKEQQQELGGTEGGQYDYGARFYDPVIGRWHVVDPLAEKMRRHNPYNYAFNNPIRYIDPDGMEGTDWKRDKDGNFVFDKYLTKENASTELQEGETYVGVDALVTSGKKLYDGSIDSRTVHRLNSDGSVKDLITGEVLTDGASTKTYQGHTVTSYKSSRWTLGLEVTGNITAAAGLAYGVKGIGGASFGKGVTAVGLEDNKIMLLGRNVFDWSQGETQKSWGELSVGGIAPASVAFKNVKNTSGSINTETVEVSSFLFFKGEQIRDLNSGRRTFQMSLNFSGSMGFGLITEYGIKIPIYKSDD